MNHDLTDELSDAASTIEVPAGDVIEVMTRSRRRSRRRQRIVALGVAAMVVAGATTIVRVANSRDETSVATDGMAVRLGDSGIDWSSQDPGAALSMFQPDTGTSTPSGALYELSTAPGEASPEGPHPRVVWRSEDGVDWSPLGRPDDLYLSDLSARGDRLYAVGTAPATARTTNGDEVPGLLVGWSDDGAGTWKTAPLGIDIDRHRGPVAARVDRPVAGRRRPFRRRGHHELSGPTWTSPPSCPRAWPPTTAGPSAPKA